jgi:hypothetical protein
MANVQVQAPGGFAPATAIGFGALGSGVTTVDPSNPLPVATGASQAAARSAVLAGNAVSSGLIGPFTPDLGRAIWVTLSGSWTGTVRVKRSTDGGTTLLPLTYIDGSARGMWSASVNAPVGEESVAGVAWFLDFQRTGGTLTYRMEQ